MLHITYITEDTVVVATIHSADSASVKVRDTLTAEEKEIECSPEELAAAMALSLGSDEIPGADELYKLAEPMMERLGGHNLRFIP